MKIIYYQLYKTIWKRTWICHLFSGIVLGGILAVLTVMMSVVHHVSSPNTYQALIYTLSEILIPLFIVFVFLLVNLLVHYFKENEEILNIFYMLGIKISDQRKFLGGLMGGIYVINLILGFSFGFGLLGIAEVILKKMSPYDFDFSVSGIAALSLIGVWTLLFLVILAFSYESWLKRNYKITSMEKLPRRFLKTGMFLSAGVILGSLWLFSIPLRFENKEILFIIILGACVFIRCFTAETVKYKTIPEKIHKVLKYHWRRRNSRTDTIFSAVVLLSILSTVFIANLNISAVLTLEPAESFYPYDMVCYAYEEDKEAYDKLIDTYDLDARSVPMVRVTNMDTTDAIESNSQNPIQGQQIGISESSYHQLKKYLDPQYQAKDLGLDREGERIYVVHQQDQTVRAQPVDYWLWGTMPLLHVGQPCEVMSYGTAVMANQWDIGFSFRKVTGEEIGSLTGIFDCTGKQENIIVFSDEYFKTARTMWKTRNYYTGEPLKPEEQEYAEVLTKEGPSRLLLLNGVNEKDRDALLAELQKIEMRHEEDFSYNRVIRNLYDSENGANDLKQTHEMKLSMGVIQILVFILMMAEILIVEIIIFREELEKRDLLFDYLGMSQKRRYTLIRKDLLRTVHLGEIAAVMIAIGLVAAVFHGRMFDSQLVLRNIYYLLPIAGIILLAVEGLNLMIVCTWLHKYGKRGSRE